MEMQTHVCILVFSSSQFEGVIW